MKQLTLLAALILFSTQSFAINVMVPVESKTGNRYYLQIMVPGSKPSEEAALTKIIQTVVPEVAKTYSTNWLMSNRAVIMSRLEKEFKQANLFCDGTGVLRLRMQGGKIVDIE